MSPFIFEVDERVRFRPRSTAPLVHVRIIEVHKAGRGVSYKGIAADGTVFTFKGPQVEGIDDAEPIIDNVACSIKETA